MPPVAELDRGVAALHPERAVGEPVGPPAAGGKPRQRVAGAEGPGRPAIGPARHGEAEAAPVAVAGGGAHRVRHHVVARLRRRAGEPARRRIEGQAGHFGGQGVRQAAGAGAARAAGRFGQRDRRDGRAGRQDPVREFAAQVQRHGLRRQCHPHPASAVFSRLDAVRARGVVPAFPGGGEVQVDPEVDPALGRLQLNPSRVAAGPFVGVLRTVAGRAQIGEPALRPHMEPARRLAVAQYEGAAEEPRLERRRIRRRPAVHGRG